MTIHPMVITLKQQSGTTIRDSVVAVSNDLKHDSTAVSQFVKVLDAHLSIMYPPIQRMVFWSDGCAAQYKSAQPFYRIANRFDQHRSLEWNYFGSNHGEGPSDGESGIVKTFASRAIAADGVCVDNRRFRNYERVY